MSLADFATCRVAAYLTGVRVRYFNYLVHNVVFVHLLRSQESAEESGLIMTLGQSEYIRDRDDCA